MLSRQQNELLTRVGPGTPGGDLMRRYWHPIYPEVLLRTKPVRKVRILGEDLTLYRDGSGKLGLIAERCPHRMTSLDLGIPEPEGLRCCYHGWLFDAKGNCLEMPLEPADTRMKKNIKIKAYAVQEMGGLIWAYLGPDPAPLLPRWHLFVRPGGFRQIVAHRLPCNWLQVMENRGDLGHAVFTHGRLFQHVLDQQGRLTDDTSARYNAAMDDHARDRAEGRHTMYRPIYNRFGFTKGRLSEGEPDDSRAWTVGINPVIFPYMLASGPGDGGIRRHYQIGVPIDDTTTWHFQYFCYVFPPELGVPEQDAVPYAEVPLKDDDGEYILDYVLAQDMVAWTGQGPIADRTQEHLGQSDACVVAYRKMLREQIDIVSAHGEPMNVFRDEDVESLELTIAGNEGAAPVLGTSVGPQLSYRSNFHKMSKGGWLYIDDDADRFCPDRDLIVELFRRASDLPHPGAQMASV
ncbi:MAG: rieske 2Fe-2S iron-sulfur domain protein [Alphaproteobacteria bacterium]|nr:rieske 2Fe-2S iron-sulfur domain protein [Alphaproteobacteria bacterium]